MRSPKPQALIDYEAWRAKGPPRFCWNCDHYAGNGACMVFNMTPPLDFTQTEGACQSWEQELPF